MSSLLARPLLAALWLYKTGVSPWLPKACRFTPTCSEYAMEALMKHGVLKGSALAESTNSIVPAKASGQAHEALK
jgi:hypothetical protein